MGAYNYGMLTQGGNPAHDLIECTCEAKPMTDKPCYFYVNVNDKICVLLAQAHPTCHD